MQGSQLCNNALSLFVITENNGLFDDIRGELVFRQRQKLSRNDSDHLGTIFGLPVLDDMLRNIVAVLVRDEH